MTHNQIIKTIILCSIVYFLSGCVNTDYPAIAKTGLDVICEDKQSLLEGKTIGLVTNHTGIDRFGNQNLTCLSQIKGLTIKRIFTPEHGFLGNHGAGEPVNNSIYQGSPIISLYGPQKKPHKHQLSDCDVLVYDIQDIGLRFYTYITTMGLAMEAAANAAIPIMILERPNPLTNKVSGPTLNMDTQSFVGAFPIHTRYGLTNAELALLIQHNDWLNATPSLNIVSMQGINRSQWFDETGLPWVPPSPNIPDLTTALIYSGLCLLEATNVSEGRGTDHPFLQFGAPWINSKKVINQLNKLNIKNIQFSPISFTPKAIPGKAPQPKYENQVCHGVRFTIIDRQKAKPIQLGKQLLQILQAMYPTQFKIDDPFLVKLWGNTAILDTIKQPLNPAREPLTLINQQ